jgi:transcriptional regulator with XRE-family HTH domain/tetratricopeptide (TPR) repeat protein
MAPLRVPADFWQRHDVGTVLDERDIGHLFQLVRKHAGASQTRIGIAVGLAQGTVSRYMTGDRVVTTIDVLQRIADGLAMPDEARSRLGLAPRPAPPTTETKETSATKRRTIVSVGLAAALDPTTVRAVLRDAAAEAMEFTRHTGVSSVGAGTFDHLEAVITDLDRSYSRQPPADRFAVARAYRQRVDQLIHGRHTLKEERELYVCAAWLSEALAWLAHDLGSPGAAQAYAIDCYHHADQAGHDELCAWAADALASIAMYADRPHHALAAAHRGLTKAPANHPLAVRLSAQAARAQARLGQPDECEHLLRETARLYERLPARTPTRFTVDTATLASYAVTAYTASSYVWLGHYREAETHARAALAVHQAAPPASRSPSREAIARIDLALALAHLHQPDEAADLGRQALASTRVVNSVLCRAGELDTALTAGYATLGCTQDFHTQYRHMTEHAPVREEHPR